MKERRIVFLSAREFCVISLRGQRRFPWKQNRQSRIKLPAAGQITRYDYIRQTPRGSSLLRACGGFVPEKGMVIGMIEPKGIGRRVQLLRKRRGLTQAQVAEAVGVSLNYISNIETGRDICSLTVMTDVVNLLNASMDFILGESLEYNKSACESGDLRAALLHEIGPLSEKECGHLLNYLSLYQKMKTELQPRKEI